MPFKIVRNDLTKMQVDVIVNTANEEPTYGDGTDTAVYEAAGVEELLEARSKIGYLDESQVAITPGFRLPAKYIIHAVSPFFFDGESGEKEKLRACYRESLKLAHQYDCKSIAFPLIATGSFGYPKEEGMRIAVDEINAFLLRHDMLIYLVVFDSKATKLGFHLYPDLEEYIDQNYVREKHQEEYGDWYSDECEYEDAALDICMTCQISQEKCLDIVEEDSAESIDDFLSEFMERNDSAITERMAHMADTFQEYLLYLIEMKGYSNAEVYKRAIVTKQTFSKIKKDPDYHPDKATAMRLCVGARLSLDETKDLLARAGYALSPCDKRDIIFSYFIEHHVHDMIEIDIALEEHGLPCFIE